MKSVGRLTIAVLLGTGCGAGGVWARMEHMQATRAAAPPVPVATDRVASLLKAASEGNVSLDKVLPDTQSGFTGAIAKAADGQRFVVWVSPKGNAFSMGALFDEKGTNLTRQVMDANQLAPEVPAPDARRPIDSNLLGSVAQAEAVKTGSGGPTAYVFIDLNCQFCAGLYKQLSPLIAQGRLRVNWIPVATLRESSLTKAAELLQAPNRAHALANHEDTHDPQSDQGGLKGQAPSPQTQIAIQANTELLKVVNKGQLATPMLIFQGANGQLFQHAGLLREATDLLAAGS